MYKLRKYHGNRVQSLTYEKDRNSASVGIMEEGQYEFGSLARETYTVTSGKISLWNNKTERWNSYVPFSSFLVPENENYKLKVDEISTYLCVYH
jgi:uncharacterized protein YaiE (UPF0345 family)